MSKSFGEKIANAEILQRAPYWLEGRYLVRINEVKLVENRKGIDCFIVTGENITSSNPERPEGMECCWVVSMAHDASPGNIKAFIAAVLEVEADEVDPEGIEGAISSQNPLNGAIIQLETYLTKTKEKQQDFTVHRWFSPTEEQTETYGEG